MLLLIEGGELYDPVPRGRKSVLIANDRIEKIGSVDRRALDALGLEYEVIDASDCVVAPGLIESPATRAAFKPEQIERLVPMKRAGTPDEVAALVSFLVSDQAGYVTGQIIGINGGMA